MFKHKNALVAIFAATLASTATAYTINANGNVVDSLNREWRDPSEVLDFTWNELDAVCFHEGEGGTRTACSGSAVRGSPRVGSVDLTGWTWAFTGEVLTLFREVVNQNGGLNGADWVSGDFVLEQDSPWAAIAVADLGATFTQAAVSSSSTGWTGTTLAGLFGQTAPSYLFVQDTLAADTFDYAGLSSASYFFDLNRVATANGAWLYRTSAVPEPATLALLGLGLAGLAAARRRKQ